VISVFVDYDGTITDLDTFDVLVRAYAGADLWSSLETRLEAGSMTLREVLAAQAAAIHVSLDEADALLERETRFDPAFAPFVSWCEQNGIALCVLSSGVQPLIERAFARHGLERVEIRANGIDPSPAGWRFQFRDDSDNGHDKAADVRAAREAGSFTVYVGDGPSDYEAAAIADVRFAKAGRGLERYLRAHGMAVTSFDSFASLEALIPRR
jgi:2-hydroxy-3-keto-5-methylthiopentenyl-1-phosphate phosphatase